MKQILHGSWIQKLQSTSLAGHNCYLLLSSVERSAAVRIGVLTSTATFHREFDGRSRRQVFNYHIYHSSTKHVEKVRFILAITRLAKVQKFCVVLNDVGVGNLSHGASHVLLFVVCEDIVRKNVPFAVWVIESLGLFYTVFDDSALASGDPSVSS